MGRKIKRYLAVLMTIAIVASGMNDFLLVTKADGVINDITTYSEESSTEYAETEEATDTVEETMDVSATVEETTTQQYEEKDKEVVQAASEGVAQAVSAAEGRHEAEEADGYQEETYKADAGEHTHNIQDSENFSGGKAVGNMNTWSNDSRSYLVKRVYAEKAGNYRLAIGYAYRRDDNDNTKKTQIQYRINGGDWIAIEARPTGDWWKVSEITATVKLSKGNNTINITGACNVWYEDEPAATRLWQQVNIDYFELKKEVEKNNIALDKPVKTSGTRTDGNDAEKAVDGDEDTRWGGIGSDEGGTPDNNWFMIDLGAWYEIDTVAILFENGRPKDFQIQVARDESVWENPDNNELWITTETVTDWDPTMNGDKAQWNSGVGYHGKARYIRIYATELYNTGWGLSIYEFVVKGSKMTSRYTNLALDQNATASSQNEYEIKNAIDGNDKTRWGSQSIIADDPNQATPWYEIDLGSSECKIHEVILEFEQAFPKDFQIQVSKIGGKDASDWKTIDTVEGWSPEGYKDGVSIKDAVYEWKSSKDYNIKARYIRIYATAVLNDSWGLSIWEFEVMGYRLSGDLTNVALNKTYDASGEDYNPKGNAIDGDDTSRWGSGANSTPWYQIDLENECEIYSVDFKFERAYPKAFVVKISSDGTTWTDIKTETDWQNPGDGNTRGGNDKLGYSFRLSYPKKAKYIRLEVKAVQSYNSISIWEFEVWGNKLNESSSDNYWNKIYEEKMDSTVKNTTKMQYGIYPIDKELYDDVSSSGVEISGQLRTELVQGDIIAKGDTYEVVYEPGKIVYFYVNPRYIYIQYDRYTICWSDSAEYSWGADYDKSIAERIGQHYAVVGYKLPAGIENNADFQTNGYVTTEIACQLYDRRTADKIFNPNEDDLKFSECFTIKIINPKAVTIGDNIETKGSLTAKSKTENAEYEWQKSGDGKNWYNVEKERDKLEILSGTGNNTVNVAYDLGGGMYYRARVKGTGDDSWSLPHKVTYYNNVQNGDFEFPAMNIPKGGTSTAQCDPDFPFGTQQGDEQQYPNGYPGLIWKTTGPGWGSASKNKVGHDIEIVNARRLKTAQENAQVSEFSVTRDEMYNSEISYGNQFAELNCENYGTLYQDILTTPGSVCCWDLDHAGRKSQNAMYVVAMAMEDAKTHTSQEQLEQFVNSVYINKNAKDAYEEGFNTTIDGATATVWKVTSPSQCGQWEHHSGKYNVPEENNSDGTDKNYLTRFFFISLEGHDGNQTIGNLLDNISFEMQKSYSIKYTINKYNSTTGEYDKITYTIEGQTDPMSTVTVPSTFIKDGVTYNVEDYTLTSSLMNNKSYFYKNSGPEVMVVANHHDTLELEFYEGRIAVTKIVQGLEDISQGVKFDVKSSTNKSVTIEMNVSDFTKIDESNKNYAGCYFATKNISANDLGFIGSVTTGTYTIAETVDTKVSDMYLQQIDIEGSIKKLSVDEIKVGKITNQSGNVTYDLSKNNSSTVINTYKPTRKITITKLVEGRFGSRSKEFDFRLSLGTKAIDYDSSKITENGNRYSFKLKHNESATFTVVDGCTATVTEADYSSEGYTTSWNDNLRTDRVIRSDIDFVCTNTSDAIITGRIKDSKPFVWVMCCTILALVCCIAGRKKLLRKVIGKK